MDKERFAGIQIARAIAALSVMYFHSWTVLDRFPKGTAHPLPVLPSYGWIGVDLFFAISGFVICLVVSKTSFNPATFLLKRSLRIYPLWLACLTAFAVLSRLWRPPLPTETAGYFLWSATLLPTKDFPFYDIGWSLQHEIAFYLMAAFIVPWSGIAGVIAALAISAFSYHALDLPWMWHDLAMYHAEFIAGILAFLLLPKFKIFGTIAPLLIGISLFGYFATGRFGGREMFPVALFFLIIGFANIAATGRAIDAGATLGDASYSIYLLHPLVFTVVKAITAIVAFPLWCEEPIRWACILFTVGFSLLSWRFFEMPLMSILRRHQFSTA